MKFRFFLCTLAVLFWNFNFDPSVPAETKAYRQTCHHDVRMTDWIVRLASSHFKSGGGGTEVSTH
jgi:hypothetical protein